MGCFLFYSFFASNTVYSQYSKILFLFSVSHTVFVTSHLWHFCDNRQWLTSTSMHSLSFLQVADMVSVVPNSKYQSLFFILRGRRGNRGHTGLWLTHELALPFLTSAYRRVQCLEPTAWFVSGALNTYWSCPLPWVISHSEPDSSWQLVAMWPQRSELHWCSLRP